MIPFSNTSEPSRIAFRLVPGGLSPESRVLGRCDHCGQLVGLAQFVIQQRDGQADRLLHTACDQVFLRKIVADAAMREYLFGVLWPLLTSVPLLCPALSVSSKKYAINRSCGPEAVLSFLAQIEDASLRTDGPYGQLSAVDRHNVQLACCDMRKLAIAAVFPAFHPEG